MTLVVKIYIAPDIWQQSIWISVLISIPLIYVSKSYFLVIWFLSHRFFYYLGNIKEIREVVLDLNYVLTHSGLVMSYDIVNLIHHWIQFGIYCTKSLPEPGLVFCQLDPLWTNASDILILLWRFLFNNMLLKCSCKMLTFTQASLVAFDSVTVYCSLNHIGHVETDVSIAAWM